MAMHDDLSEILLVQEKIVSYPEQVMLALVLQRDSRSYAGMGEEEITTGE